MKNFLIMLFVLFVGGISQAQTTDAAAVGKVVYYEGKVELGTGDKWTPVKINSIVARNQTIRTVGDAMAEISWSNGTKSIVGPNSKLTIQALLAGSTSNAKAGTEGVFTGFKMMFNEGPGKKRSEEGGIRRSEVEEQKTPGKDEIYWKEDKEINFSEAYSLYENKEFGKAIAALQAFLNQKPKDEMAKYAMFALGHSYIMSNNPIKAKEIFEQFVAQYPTDALKADADKVLKAL